MAASEIDDIFTGIASTSSAPLDARKQGKKAKDAAKKSSRKRADDSVAGVGTAAATTKAATAGSAGKDGVAGGKKRRAETVLDPSSAIEAKVAKKRKAGSCAEKLSEADEDFRDTRGRNRELATSYVYSRAAADLVWQGRGRRMATQSTRPTSSRSMRIRAVSGADRCSSWAGKIDTAPPHQRRPSVHLTATAATEARRRCTLGGQIGSPFPFFVLAVASPFPPQACPPRRQYAH